MIENELLMFLFYFICRLRHNLKKKKKQNLLVWLFLPVKTSSFSIQPSLVQRSNSGPIHDHHYIWNPLIATNGSTLSASFPPLLSFRPKWGRSLRLSRGGDVRLEGEASFCLFVLMVEPAGLHQNALMVPSRHPSTKSALLSRLQAILENPADSSCWSCT